MGKELILLSKTLEASADLSSYQYHAMQWDAYGKAALADASSEVVGILQNQPDAAGKESEIAMIGLSKAVYGDTVTQGAYLAPDSNGHLVPTTTNADGYIGIAMEAGSANDIRQVFLVPFGLLSASHSH